MSIGDTVTYMVPVTIPEDVFEVPIIVTDTIDQALTLNEDSLEADQGGKDKPEPDPDKPTPDPDKPNQDLDKPMPNPDHPDKPSKAPQTGQLWWPVIALGCAGSALLAVGIFKKKGK